MTIGELKEAIKDIDDDTKIAIYDYDTGISNVRLANNNDMEIVNDELPGEKVFALITTEITNL